MGLTYKQIIDGSIIPHVKYFFSKIAKEKEDIEVDGVKAFAGGDKFAPGKVVNAFSYVLVNMDKSCEEFDKFVDDFREIIRFTAKYEMKTWSIFYYLTCLERLKENGLFETVLHKDSILVLKQKLDWRVFVNEKDLTLIDLPTNYYGCAFGVARLRELLGWDEEPYSKKLFDIMMKHIREYSGGLGFSDETPGEGRFDRYTVLLPGEVCLRLIETKMEVPNELKEMLRKSCEIHLKLANEQGHGFRYGRTIGTYGDTSVLEVLSVAALLNVLSDEEKELAYAYNVKVAEKFAEFWIDEEMHSVNLWEKGRKADPYMGKGRILGENLSLSMQLINVNDIWKEAGFENKLPTDKFKSMLLKLPKNYFVRFADGEYDRGLVIVRDGKFAINLPIISGGNHQYCNTPYFPIPNEFFLFGSSPAEKHPIMLPRFTLSDASVLMPLAYMKNIETKLINNVYSVKYKMDEMCKLGGILPQKDSRMKSVVEYTFTKGSIKREETFIPVVPLDVTEIYMELVTYSKAPMILSNKVSFLEGSLKEFKVNGLYISCVEVVEKENAYNTPHGALMFKVICKKENLRITKPFKVTWVVKYS